jgi:soluble lytic murein transglycosylase-like protein
MDRIVLYVNAAVRCALGVALFVIAPASAFADTPASGKLAPLSALYGAARDPAAALEPASLDLVDRDAAMANAASLWPLQVYLLAEAERIRGDSAGARVLLVRMVAWCSADPYHDGLGASGLCPVALWRLLAGDASDPAARSELLATAVRYWNAKGRLAQGMFGAAPIFGALPQLREDILRRTIELAWSLDDKAQAYRSLGDYLAVAREWPLAGVAADVLASAESERPADYGKPLLALGKRLYGLNKEPEAKALFLEAQRLGDATTAADARLQLAQFLRDARGRACATPELRAEVDAVLAASADPDLTQRALLSRARKYLVRSCTVDVAQFESDLARLQTQFPRSQPAFQATSELASFELERWLDGSDGDALDRSLVRFAQARALATEALSGTARIPEQQGNVWLRPALALYARNAAGDLRDARELLRQLDERAPDGALRLSARFWRARLASESGRRDEARALWQRVIDENPYDYYAVRARLRLALGEAARGTIELDPRTRKALGAAFAASVKAHAAPAGTSPYHERVRAALAEKVYQSGFASLSTLRRDASPGRALEDVTLEALDAAGRAIDVFVALSLRQDALVAADQPLNAANRLQLARLVGQWPSSDWLRGDWPLAVALSAPYGARPDARRELQHDARFLAAAYPDAYRDLIVQAGSQWQVDPALLYAVVRTETVFNPWAESNRGALGLFQFMPATFRGLNDKWHLVNGDDKTVAEIFLLTPQNNIRLGARWFAEELLKRQNGNVLWALMSHNAGPDAVDRWKAMWRRLGRADDIEFMVDTVRFDETRGFAQRALTTLWLVRSTPVGSDRQGPR